MLAGAEHELDALRAMPVLTLEAGGDELVGRGQTHALAGTLPAARSLTVPGASHHDLFTGPGFLAGAAPELRRFYGGLARLGPRRRHQLEADVAGVERLLAGMLEVDGDAAADRRLDLAQRPSRAGRVAAPWAPGVSSGEVTGALRAFESWRFRTSRWPKDHIDAKVPRAEVPRRRMDRELSPRLRVEPRQGSACEAQPAMTLYTFRSGWEPAPRARWPAACCSRSATCTAISSIWTRFWTGCGRRSCGPGRSGSACELVMLGDYVDRGPDSLGTLRRV